MTRPDAERVSILDGPTAIGLTLARRWRTLLGWEKLLRKLRSFLTTVISVNPPCKLLFCNVKNGGCVLTET
jgi:hypothetical protein